MRSLAAAFALAALACQSASGPGSGPAGSPQSPPAATSAGCGENVSRDFMLANDLSCPKDALVVTADGITIDLGGKTLTGPGKGQRNWPAANLDSVGVKVQGRKNVTVRNGKISSFSTGVLLDGASDVVIEDVTSERSYYGVYFNNTTRSTLRRSIVTLNTYGPHLQRSNDNAILDNQLVRQEYSSPGGYGLYLFGSQRNRIVGNTIEGNLNWGIWFSDARENVIFRNNVARNSPQVSDNVGGNTWYDSEKKEGNYWADYGGIDRNADGVGDSPYRIGGPGDQVDPYPFVERDGWNKRRSQTIDTYAMPPPKPAREVRLLALAGGAMLSASPSETSASMSLAPASSIAIAPDQRTVYALSGSVLRVMDAVTGNESGRFAVDVAGIVAANRDGRTATVVGANGAVMIDVQRPDLQRLRYASEPRAIAPSWKHNILFVSTEKGVDIFYVGQRGGNVPYTIPLDGAGGAMTMNRSGTRLYVVAQGRRLIDVIDTEQYAVVDALAVPWEPVALAVAPDEGTVYLAAREGVAAFDLATRALRGSRSFAGTPVDIGMSPNGDQVYVALDGVERGIAVLSATELRTENLVRLEASPTRLAVVSY
jgi:parallel beta-helix repeat protein